MTGILYRVRARFLHRYQLGHTYRRIHVCEPGSRPFLRCTWCGHSRMLPT